MPFLMSSNTVSTSGSGTNDARCESYHARSCTGAIAVFNGFHRTARRRGSISPARRSGPVHAISSGSYVRWLSHASTKCRHALHTPAAAPRNAASRLRSHRGSCLDGGGARGGGTRAASENREGERRGRCAPRRVGVGRTLISSAVADSSTSSSA